MTSYVLIYRRTFIVQYTILRWHGRPKHTRCFLILFLAVLFYSMRLFVNSLQDLPTSIYKLHLQVYVSCTFSFKINYSNKSSSDLDPNNDNSTPSDCTSYSTMETDTGNTQSASDQSNLYSEYFNAAEAATERVAELIHDDFEVNHLFCQMDILRMYKDDLVWKEMAR